MLFGSGEEQKLAQRMDSVGMLGLVRRSEVRRPGGMFGVDKKMDPQTGEMTLRFTFDRRPRNAVEEPLRDLCGLLAQGAVLCDLILEPHECARLWLSDLPNYYYTFIVSPERMKTNAWGNPIPRAEAQRHENAWAALEARGESTGEWFYRAANTMAMGDTNAVEFGQGAHVGILAAAGGMQVGEALEAAQPAPRGPVWQGVVVDDHAIIARVSRSGSSVDGGFTDADEDASEAAGDPVAAVMRGGVCAPEAWGPETAGGPAAAGMMRGRVCVPGHITADNMQPEQTPADRRLRPPQKDSAAEASSGAALARARGLWASALGAYDAAGLSPVPEKSVVEAPAGRVWGAWLEGEAGNVGVPRSRRAELAMVSLDIAALGWSSRGLRRKLTIAVSCSACSNACSTS